VAQQGSIFSVAIDPTAVIEALKTCELPIEVIGPADEWRMIVVRPRDTTTSGPGTLTLKLKTRTADQLYFKRQIPRLIAHLGRVPAHDIERQSLLQELAPHLGVCINMTADPGFSAHPEFIEAMTVIARLLDGFFVIPIGLLDAESRELLLNDGSGNPDAVMPKIPEFPALAGAKHAFEDIAEPANDPPEARRVAERMYVMLAVAFRGILDMNSESDERQRKLHQLGEWFWSLEIGHELEDWERHVLDQPLGAISREQAEQLVWGFEAVMVLAWSLGLVEMSAHDEFVQPRKIADTLGLFSEDTHFVIDSADLRDPLDLRAAADVIMAVHWRLREFEISRTQIDFAQLERDWWFGPIDLNGIALADGDVSIGGVPILQADNALRQRVHAAIQSRHRAINWLCGHHRVFSRVDTST
jgi:hypothetical protein